MADTTLFSSISRSDSFPKMVSISAPANKGYISLATHDWTDQMFYELPAIKFEVYVPYGSTYAQYKDFCYILKTSDNSESGYQNTDKSMDITNIPSDAYIFITPLFDNSAFESHNQLIIDGIEEGSLWDTQTMIFDIESKFIPASGSSPSPTPTLITKSITQNGNYKASDDVADGYSEVDISVPNTYAQSDEGKVVNQGTLVAQTAMSSEITANNIYDTTLFNSVTVNVSGGGGSSDSKNDVVFYDYDGTVVYSYTRSEFADLTEMPENPTHNGLTAQGWNLSLSDAKTYAGAYGKLNIGQMYTTDDGKTRIYISLHDGRLEPRLGLGINGSVEVDWGDGTAHDTMTGASLSSTVYQTHTYTSEGEYVITLTSTGYVRFNGSSGSSYLLTKQGGNGETNRVYVNSINRIEIGSGMTSISAYAFSGCSELSSITIPQGVTWIGSSAFSSCFALSSITIPSSVTSIADSAFSGCRSLLSVTIPQGVTSISDSTFSSCSSLSSVTIPSSVTLIDKSAFSTCYALSSITIPSSVTSIGSSAFKNCSALSSITIPSSVTSISSNAFSSCSALSSITIPSSVTSISNYAFNVCSALSSITIPQGVTSIGNYAFSGCFALSSITIPQGVTSIGDYAFSSCSALSSITIPQGVTSIGSSAFSSCRSLSSITIPSSVTLIDKSAFSSCYGLGKLTFENSTPATASSNAFSNLSTDCIIYVPQGSLSSYTSKANYPSSSTYTYVEY